MTPRPTRGMRKEPRWSQDGEDLSGLYWLSYSHSKRGRYGNHQEHYFGKDFGQALKEALFSSRKRGSRIRIDFLDGAILHVISWLAANPQDQWPYPDDPAVIDGFTLDKSQLRIALHELTKAMRNGQ